MKGQSNGLLAGVCICLLGAWPILGRADEATPRGLLTLSPGDTHAFPAADVASGSELLGATQLCVTHPSVLAPPQTDFEGALSFAVAGTTLADGAGCMVFRYNDFKIDAGPEDVYADVPVHAMVSGKLDWAGLLVMLNIGTVNTVFSMDVIDVTDPNPANHRVVASQTLATESLTGDSTLSFGFSLSVDAGSMTAAQVGISPGIGFGVPVKIQRVVKNTGFNIPALLQRGHTYRLQFSATGSLTAGFGGGAGGAIFVDVWELLGINPETDVPDLLSPSFWVSTFSGQNGMNLTLPSVNLTGFADSLPNVTLPQISLPWPSYFNLIVDSLDTVCRRINPLPGAPGCPSWPTMPSNTTLLAGGTTLINTSSFANSLLSAIGDCDGDGSITTNDILCKLGVSKEGQEPTLTDVLGPVLGVAENIFPPLHTFLPQGGVKLSDLAVTLAVDEVEELALHDEFVADQFAALGATTEAEFLNLNEKFNGWIDESTRIRIENSLTSSNPVARFMLPEQFGGQLELVAQVVAETIQLMKDAGQPIFNSEMEFAGAVAAQNAGDYKEAFRRYAKAYNRATQ